MLPDVLQAGSMLPLADWALRSISACALVPIGLGFAAYVWLCVKIRYR